MSKFINEIAFRLQQMDEGWKKDSEGNYYHSNGDRVFIQASGWTSRWVEGFFATPKEAMAAADKLNDPGWRND
jgi:hypothetical protein